MRDYQMLVRADVIITVKAKNDNDAFKKASKKLKEQIPNARNTYAIKEMGKPKEKYVPTWFK